MSRSIYKMPYVHRSLLSICIANRQKTYSATSNLQQAVTQKSKEKIKNIPRFLYF